MNQLIGLRSRLCGVHSTDRQQRVSLTSHYQSTPPDMFAGVLAIVCHTNLMRTSSFLSGISTHEIRQLYICKFFDKSKRSIYYVPNDSTNCQYTFRNAFLHFRKLSKIPSSGMLFSCNSPSHRRSDRFNVEGWSWLWVTVTWLFLVCGSRSLPMGILWNLTLKMCIFSKLK